MLPNCNKITIPPNWIYHEKANIHSLYSVHSLCSHKGKIMIIETISSAT